jgi:hypothetical protein
MRHTDTYHRRSVPATGLILLLACLGLAACGGSSGSSSSTTTVAANTAPSGGRATGPANATIGPAGGRFAAMRACLAKEGITLPQRTPGQPRTPGAGGFLGVGPGGGPQLPKGVTRAKFEAALKKCGGGGAFAVHARLGNPAVSKTLATFAACMRQHGINLPSPNSSGTGPVFSTKGIDTASAKFKAAETKCQSVLRSAFTRRPRTG